MSECEYQITTCIHSYIHAQAHAQYRGHKGTIEAERRQMAEPKITHRENIIILTIMTRITTIHWQNN